MELQKCALSTSKLKKLEGDTKTQQSDIKSLLLEAASIILPSHPDTSTEALSRAAILMKAVLRSQLL